MIIGQAKDCSTMGFGSTSTLIFVFECASPSDCIGPFLNFIFTISIALIVNQFIAHESKVPASCNTNQMGA